MKISKGRQQVPIKVVVYGSEGIGKTTLASQFPNPLFLDVESGTKQLDVARIDKDYKEWNDITYTLDELDRALAKDKSICKTLVIDTIDVAETLLSEQIVKDAHNSRITSLSDFAYGAGQVKLRERMNDFLKKLDLLREKHGIHTVLLAHSHLRKCEKPDETGSYDRYELKLNAKVAERIKEWCDVLLFINYKTQIVSSGNKMEKNKLVGGKRVIYTTHHTAWDAKNRFSLPEELPLEYEAIKEIFNLDDYGIHITDENDPALAEPSITLKANGDIEVHDEDGNIIDDPDFEEIESPSALKALEEMMKEDDVSEKQIIEALIKIGKLPAKKDGRDPKLSDLKEEFIQKTLIEPWDSLLRFLHKNVA